MSVETWLADHELPIRVACFAAVFVVVALWELRAPARAAALARRSRWPNNLALVALDALLVRLLFPAAGVGMAVYAGARGWGVLNAITLPGWLEVALAVIVLDFAIWLQHVAVHAVPAFWRLHRVHHADPHYDLTTGARFHPLEIVLSMLVKFAVIAAIGAPAVAVIAFEIILNGAAMFNHGNVRLPDRLDRALRWFVVTPDMHRVHHSVRPEEANSNFGFNLSWWDRLFGTYRAQPRGGPAGLRIGIRDFTDPRDVTRLTGMLALPFRDAPRARRARGAQPL